MSLLDERLGLQGKSVWVVGAGGGGIGTAVCAELAAAGAQVIAIDRSEEALEATLDACRQATHPAKPYAADATSREALQGVSSEERKAGRIPAGLVNIVGGLQRDQFGSILDTEEATLDAVLKLNLKSSWTASQVFAELLCETEKPGSLVQLASIAALQGMPFGATYAMAKAALISLSSSQALEWGPAGIRVNTIAAGTIRTPRSVSHDPELDRQVIPLGRRGLTTEIAGAALFLLSDLASFVTGQVLAVDGGASVKPSYLGSDGLPVFVQDEDLRDRLFGKDRTRP